MSDLINVNYNADRPTVSARELHRLLEIRTAFNDWFPRMCEFGFEAGKDFYSFLSKSTGGRPCTEYQITLDMAKQIIMVQRTPQAMYVRQQLIDIENQWNSPEMVMSRALDFAKRKLDTVIQQNDLLSRENAEMKPKAEFFDEFIEHGKNISFTDTAKLIGCGRKQLIDALMERKYIYRDARNEIRAYCAGIKAGLFTHNPWCKNGTSGIQVLITPKGVDMCRRLMKEDIKIMLPSSDERQTRATK